MRLQMERLWMLGLLLLLPSRPMAQQPPSRFHPQLIGITAEQQKKLEAFFAASGQQRRAVGSHLHSLYHELETLYDSYEFDAQRALDLRKQIVEQQGRLLALHGDNEIKLRQILNAEQFARLRAQMKSWRGREQHHDRGPGHDDHAHEPKN